MLNKQMYLSLVKLYESRESPRTLTSLYDIKRDAMVIAGHTYLTFGEDQACREVWENFKQNHPILTTHYPAV